MKDGVDCVCLGVEARGLVIAVAHVLGGVDDEHSSLERHGGRASGAGRGLFARKDCAGRGCKQELDGITLTRRDCLSRANRSTRPAMSPRTQAPTICPRRSCKTSSGTAHTGLRPTVAREQRPRRSLLTVCRLGSDSPSASPRAASSPSSPLTFALPSEQPVKDFAVVRVWPGRSCATACMKA